MRQSFSFNRNRFSGLAWLKPFAGKGGDFISTGF